MKKTITVNLGGRAFLITEEAYNSLNDYLSSLATSFKGHDSCDEIIADIEARISELCEKRLAQNHSETIELDLVNEMINRMGRPESMLPDDEQLPGDEKTSSNKEEEKESIADNIKELFGKIELNKKYYLNTDDRMLGGVISGLAAYLKIDVTILRIIALIAIIASSLVGVIIYLAVWCIAPTAGNTTEKLRMQGITPTPENIAETITGTQRDDKSSPITTEKEKNNITRLLVIAIIAAIGFIWFRTSFISINSGFNRFDTNYLMNGCILLFCVFMAGVCVQKAKLPDKLKTILLVATILFALFVIFVTLMNAFNLMNGCILLFCVFMAGVFVQKAKLPDTLKTILLVATILFALFVIFVTLTNTF